MTISCEIYDGTFGGPKLYNGVQQLTSVNGKRESLEVTTSRRQ